jgi:hypothetical protein
MPQAARAGGLAVEIGVAPVNFLTRIVGGLQALAIILAIRGASGRGKHISLRFAGVAAAMRGMGIRRA